MSDDEDDDGIKYEVRIENDPDVGDPSKEDGAWRIYSFCSRHVNYRHPQELMAKPWEDRQPAGWLRRKLKLGLAFQLAYYEHGLCSWFIAGTMSPPDMEWDGNSLAGFAIWEEPANHMGAKTYLDRMKDCTAYVEEYTNWCNGNCYHFAIEELPGKYVDASGGFIGEESVCDGIIQSLPDDATAENTRVVGEAAWINNYHPIFKKEVKHAQTA